jgi:hypothetical protein
MMNENEVTICLVMEQAIIALDAILALENAKGDDKDNEKARFYAVARTHQQTALAYFEYWLSQREMLRRIASTAGGGR